MKTPGQVVFVACAALSVVFSILALRNIADEEPGDWFRNAWRIFVRGPFAGRETLTPRGWQYRNAALGCMAAALLALFLWR